jgi:hypothetical protein
MIPIGAENSDPPPLTVLKKCRPSRTRALCNRGQRSGAQVQVQAQAPWSSCTTRARCPAWRALVSLKLRMRLPDFQRCPTALDLIRRRRRMQRLKGRQVAR